MSILAWIVIGIVAGYLAKAILPGVRPGGLPTDLALGAVGALAAGWLIRAVGFGGTTGLSLWTAVAAIAGAAALLYASRAMMAPNQLN